MTLTQRLNFLIVLFALCGTNLIATHTALATEAASKPITPAKKTPEAAFNEGLQCLKAANVACAQLALIYIPSQSANAKVLSSGIALLQGNEDLAFRLLLPLEADTTLQPLARASLHASLSLAYEKLPDTLRAIEQKILEEQVLIANSADVAVIQPIQTKLWALVSNLSRAQLIEMRGESAEADLQGWIDLALAQQDQASITDWQKAYPDHSANAIAASLLQVTPMIKSTTHQPLKGKVALLLPIGNERLVISGLALQRGFSASASVDNSPIEIKSYAINADEKTTQDISNTYNQAINEGASYVVIANLTNTQLANVFPVPTLLLDTSLSPTITAKNLHVFSLSFYDEASLIAKTAREFGMQNILIVSQDSSAFDTTSATFNEAWQQMGGQKAKQIKVANDSNLLDIKAQISSQQNDMILIAGDAAFARKIRPYLDIATPTFGFSSIDDGMPGNTLNAIRFAEFPWLLKPADFNAYQASSAEIGSDTVSQRWFATGADAYQILTLLNPEPIAPHDLNGLTGKIHIDASGVITRQPALGSFTNNGVMLEK